MEGGIYPQSGYSAGSILSARNEIAAPAGGFADAANGGLAWKTEQPVILAVLLALLGGR